MASWALRDVNSCAGQRLWVRRVHIADQDVIRLGRCFDPCAPKDANELKKLDAEGGPATTSQHCPSSGFVGPLGTPDDAAWLGARLQAVSSARPVFHELCERAGP